MKKKRSKRNKTMTLSSDEERLYLSKCITNITTLLNETDVIIHNDMFQCVDKIPSKSVDLLIVDPPYNLTKKYGTSVYKKTCVDEYTAFTNEWVSKVKPTLKDSASIYVCSDWRTSVLIAPILQKHFIVNNRTTWQREKGRGAQKNWKNGMEDIWFCSMSANYTFNVNDVKIRKRVIAPYKTDGVPKDWEETKDGKFRDTYPSNFWDDISIPYWSMPENTSHPTQKPEKLIAKLILASSNENDVVLDPFLGSGTTSVVAKKLNRRFIGIEREAEYCAVAQKRLQNANNDKEIQGYTDKIFWERNTSALQQKYKRRNNGKQI